MAKSTVLGVILAAALVFPAMAQLDLPCDAFAIDDDGTWYATQQITVGTAIGLVDVAGAGQPRSRERPGCGVPIGDARRLLKSPNF
jgi:hypothetical protein